MSNGYKWSGGPWIIDHWTKGVEIVLVPNPKFWGTKPKLDKVTFKVQADTAAEFESFKNNEVSMIYPQPQLDVVDQLKAGLPDSKSSVNSNTGNARSAVDQQRVRSDGRRRRASGTRLLHRPRRDREAAVR